jgi:mRNA interferase MazF
MKKGKIVLTRFPFTNLSSDKRRPALILIDTEASDPDTIVAFISSVIPES